MSAHAIKISLVMQVNIRDGSVADAYLLEDDFVHASHNFGIHLWDDLLLIVGVRNQLCSKASNDCMIQWLSGSKLSE